jgi:membrane protease YdiL (CAAX protease family)
MEELLANPKEGLRQVLASPEYLLFLGGLFAVLLLVLHHRKNPPDPIALTRRLSERALGFFDIYGLILLYLGLFVGAMFTGRFFYEEQMAVAKLGIALLIYTVVSCAIVATAWRNKLTIESGFGMGIRNLKTLGLAPLFYLAIIPLLLLLGVALKWIGYEMPLQDNAQQFVESNPTERILFAIMAILAAPLFEELLFRGTIFPALLKRMGLTAAILLVSCLFSLLHFHFFVFMILFAVASVVSALFWKAEDPRLKALTRALLAAVLLFSGYITFASGSFHSFLSLMVLSTGTCLAYWRTGSLWASIGMHAVFNAVTIYSLSMAG